MLQSISENKVGLNLDNILPAIEAVASNTETLAGASESSDLSALNTEAGRPVQTAGPSA
jgi:hypothetical protein